MPSPRMPRLAARGAEHRPLALAVPSRVAAARAQPAGAAVERELAPGRGLERDAREAAAPTASASGSSAQRRPSWRRARACPRSRRRVARRARPAFQPSREASQPNEQQRRGARVGVVADRDRGDRARARARSGGGSKRRGDALAPRRRAQPGEVDDVGLLRQRRAHAAARPRASGSSTESQQHDLGQAQQRVDRLAVAVRRPQQRRQVGDDERVDDRVEVRRGARSPRSRTTCSRGQRELAVRGSARSSAIDRDARVERRAPRLDRADDRARGVVAADAAQAVGDLAAPLGGRRCATRLSTRAGHVRRRSRRGARRAGARSAASIAVGRRVLRAPDVSRRIGASGIRSRASRRRRAAARRPPAGPCVPAAYCGSGPGVACPAARRSGRRSRHCASTSSLRVNSVASPRIASMISRS